MAPRPRTILVPSVLAAAVALVIACSSQSDHPPVSSAGGAGAGGGAGGGGADGSVIDANQPDTNLGDDAGEAGGADVSPGCGPATCSGCCDLNAVCQAGTGNTVCGSGGIICVDCQGGRCTGGLCQ
jgi:hypothetical protein